MKTRSYPRFEGPIHCVIENVIRPSRGGYFGREIEFSSMGIAFNLQMQREDVFEREEGWELDLAQEIIRKLDEFLCLKVRYSELFSKRIGVWT